MWTNCSAVTLNQNNFQRITKALPSLIRFQTTATNHITIGENFKCSSDAERNLQHARPLQEMPRTTPFKVLRGSLPGGRYYRKDAKEFMLLMEKEYGKIFCFPKFFGFPEMVITFDANDFESVFRNEGIWPERPGLQTLRYYREKHRAEFFQGIEGVAASQGEKWSKFRSIVNPVLMQPKNARLYLPKMAEVSQEFIERIKAIRDPRTKEMPENFEKIINRWTLESVALVALDKKLGLLNSERIDATLQKYFDSLNEFFYLSGELDAKPSMWRIVPIPKFKRIMKVLDEISETTTLYINEAIVRFEQGQGNVEKRGAHHEKSVLEKLLQIDKKVAMVMAMDLLIAGVDTTSTTFASTLLCLAKNPSKQEKLREELRKILPTKNSNITEKFLNEIPYLRACIKESLRLYPLANANLRVVQQDVVLSGYKVPKNTVVLMMNMLCNRDEAYFSNPNEFLPERWLRQPQDGATVSSCPTKSSNPFVSLPFGFGPRSCIGKRIAELELEVGIARVIRNFDVAFNYPTENAFKTVLINVPNVPLKFEFKDVEE